MKNDINIQVQLGKINDTQKVLDYPPQMFSFSIEESIYSVIPTASITMQDILGVGIETLVFEKGNEIEILAKSENARISNTFVVTNYSTSPNTGSAFNPDVNLLLAHKILNSQTEKSAVYTGRISNILRTVFKEYSFTPLSNDTGNSADWYQLNETDLEFLKRLTKYMYSKNANQTPFCAWLDIDNKFNIRNMSSMESTKPVAEFYVTTGGQGKNYKNIANNLTKIDDVSFNTVKNKGINQYFIDPDTGELKKETYLNSDFPKSTNKKRLQANSKELVTSNIFQLFSDTQDNGILENRKGEVINSKRMSYFTERFAFSCVTSDASLKLRAGNNIKLVSSIAGNENSVKRSPYFEGGNFVIEKKIDSWESTTGKMNTYFVVGRRLINTSPQVPAYSALD